MTSYPTGPTYQPTALGESLGTAGILIDPKDQDSAAFLKLIAFEPTAYG